jgi:prophage maintenance system killer protein
VGDYGNPLNEAAVLIESIVCQRPFSHLNTATAFAVLMTLLGLNGYRLACPPGEAVRALGRWAVPTAEWPQLAAWLQHSTEKLDNNF